MDEAKGEEKKPEVLPPEGLECLVCFDDICVDNCVEYCTSAENGPWFVSYFCEYCVEELRKTQFQRYLDSVANSTCAREQRALLSRGPPIKLFDNNGFPEAGNNEIYALRNFSSGKPVKVMLEGALIGDARIKLWEEQKNFAIKDEDEKQQEEGPAKEGPAKEGPAKEGPAKEDPLRSGF